MCLATYLGFQWVIRDSLKRRLLGWDGCGRAGAEDAEDPVDGEIGGSSGGGGGLGGGGARVVADGGEGGSGGGGVRKPVEFRKVAAQHKARIAAILCVCFMSAGFWAVYEQQGNTTALFADDHVDRGGLPTEFVQAVNPFMILALTPLLTRLWEWQARRGSEPTQITKMGIGAGLVSVSYLILAAAASAAGAGTGTTGTGGDAGTSGGGGRSDGHVGDGDGVGDVGGVGGVGGGKMGAGWLVLHLTVLTAGELYLSPVGLSFMTVVSPRELASMMMGVWFLSSFLGNYLSGELGAVYAYTEAPTFFTLTALIAAGVSGVMLVSSSPLMHLLDPSRL